MLLLHPDLIGRCFKSSSGPSNGMPKPKSALPWAGKLHPMPEENAMNGAGTQQEVVVVVAVVNRY